MKMTIDDLYINKKLSEFNKKICYYCKQEIKDNQETNLIFGVLSHKKCDEKYFKRQEKKVKYLNYKQEIRGEF